MAPRRDDEGKIICPQCQRHYTPLIESQAWKAMGNSERNPDIPIQVQFPGLEPHFREQVISGLCSDKCFDEFIGRIYGGIEE